MPLPSHGSEHRPSQVRYSAPPAVVQPVSARCFQHTVKVLGPVDVRSRIGQALDLDTLQRQIIRASASKTPSTNTIFSRSISSNNGASSDETTRFWRATRCQRCRIGDISSIHPAALAAPSAHPRQPHRAPSFAQPPLGTQQRHRASVVSFSVLGRPIRPPLPEYRHSRCFRPQAPVQAHRF